jgi:hypothetical protein
MPLKPTALLFPIIKSMEGWEVNFHAFQTHHYQDAMFISSGYHYLQCYRYQGLKSPVLWMFPSIIQISTLAHPRGAEARMMTNIWNYKMHQQLWTSYNIRLQVDSNVRTMQHVISCKNMNRNKEKFVPFIATVFCCFFISVVSNRECKKVTDKEPNVM